MTGNYHIDRRGGYGCAAYRNGLQLDLTGYMCRDPENVALAVLVEHFRLSHQEALDLASGSGNTRSMMRVRRLAHDLATIFNSRFDSFDMTTKQLDQLINLQSRCWLPDDHVWAPDPVHGWVAGQVVEVRIGREKTVVETIGGKRGRPVSGVYEAKQLQHRSKGARPPWKT